MTSRLVPAALALGMALPLSLSLRVGAARADEDAKAREARLEAQAKAYAPKFSEPIAFDAAQWQTNETAPPVGDPRAKKGGMLTGSITQPLPTFRTDGPESNLVTITNIAGLIYESLIGIHPNTLDFVPGLATHWQFDYDAKVLRFRIDPRARWADGSEVTADDVVATWEHMAGALHRGDGTEDAAYSRKDPYAEQLYGKSFEKPVAEDKLTVRVKMTEDNWRLPIYFGGMPILPAKYIRCSGADYLEAYQWKWVMGSGPYHMRPGDHVEQESYVFTRRQDWWNRDDPANVGLYNFDKIRLVVVRDDTLEFEKLKKGEIDYYFTLKAQRWAEEYGFEGATKGWVKRNKVYTKEPQGFAGLAFNMRKKPFDDVRVRKAFAHLFNREKLNEKLFYNQYDFVDSYWPGSMYANPSNPKIRYDPRLAADLLAQAGWKERNADGWLVKDGKVFELLLELGSPTLERIYTVVQEDFRSAGIKLELKLTDPVALTKKVQEREFAIHQQAWAAILFPNPESMWGSEVADKPATTNLTGFKSEKVDKLCGTYDRTRDLKRRIQIIQKIDEAIFAEHPYALGWYGPFTRIAYSHKLGHPERFFSATGRPEADILALWWHDPERAKELEEAKRTGASLPAEGPVDVKPWEDFDPAKTQSKAAEK
jgi:microcin C transport system substrate-binding protein